MHKKFAFYACFLLHDSLLFPIVSLPLDLALVREGGRKSPGCLRALEDGSMMQLWV